MTVIYDRWGHILQSLSRLSSSIPMPGEQSQYGIPILMTDERASQVSHSS